MLEYYNGKAYTFAITTHYGTGASTIAGVYCYNYAPTGAGSTQHSWYLPASGELYNYFHANKNLITQSWNKLNTSIPNNLFWSANEIDYYAAWTAPQPTQDVGYEGFNKANSYSVACFYKI